ncbi:MAG: hypothetical protein ABH814_02330 [bacterium]
MGKSCGCLFLICFSLMHLTRNTLQDLKIKTKISTILTKKTKTPTWSILNLWTYILAMVEIFLECWDT